MTNPAPTGRNTPIYALVALAAMLIVGVVLIVTDHGEAGGGALIIGVLVANLPGAIAAIYAERTSRDVRNGTVTEVVRQGAAKAIEDKQVVTQQTVGPIAEQSIGTLAEHTKALAALLDRTESAAAKVEAAAETVNGG